MRASAQAVPRPAATCGYARPSSICSASTLGSVSCRQGATGAQAAPQMVAEVEAAGGAGATEGRAGRRARAVAPHCATPCQRHTAPHPLDLTSVFWCARCVPAGRRAGRVVRRCRSRRSRSRCSCIRRSCMPVHWSQAALTVELHCVLSRALGIHLQRRRQQRSGARVSVWGELSRPAAARCTIALPSIIWGRRTASHTVLAAAPADT